MVKNNCMCKRNHFDRDSNHQLPIPNSQSPNPSVQIELVVGRLYTSMEEATHCGLTNILALENGSHGQLQSLPVVSTDHLIGGETFVITLLPILKGSASLSGLRVGFLQFLCIQKRSDGCGFWSVIGVPNMAPSEESAKDESVFGRVTKTHLRFWDLFVSPSSSTNPRRTGQIPNSLFRHT
ncbi:hypothetical protein VNO78_18140 [Psophocarpus tetragonolobus]|uniref:Uncharacterized protein n=1 Tax=Psophocarpus tetragonolobus TaxID=3891 RepID=A0AAN9SI92_PSOTE